MLLGVQVQRSCGDPRNLAVLRFNLIHLPEASSSFDTVRDAGNSALRPVSAADQ